MNKSLEYIKQLYAPQDALLDAICAELERANMAIQIGAEEGRLLQLLIAMNNVKTIVEIGTLAGYSTIWMARALPEDGHIYTINRDEKHIKMAKNNFAKCECGEKITMLEGDAHKMLPMLVGKEIDMIFIDADKISYNDYLDFAEENLRVGGLIIADNVLLGGSVADNSPPSNHRVAAPTTWNNMRRFNERLADKSKYNSTIIPTSDGLTVAIKRK